MNLSSFASLFPFRTLGSAQSSFNTLLDSKDVSIDKLLDEENFTTQFKSQNPKLMQFLKYDKYQILIEYITKVGPEDDNKRSCKYPFIAAEVLTSDNNTLVDYFLPEKDLFIEEEVVEEVETEEQFEVEDDTPEQQKVEVQAIPLEPEVEVQKEEEEIDLQKIKKQVQDTEQKGETQGQTKEVETQQESPKEQSNEATKEEQEQKSQEAQSLEEQEQKKPRTRIQKRMVRKEVINKVKKQVQPLIQELFSYLDEELNYVLAGYFSKVVTWLFSKKLTSLSTYIFQEGRYLKLLKHIASRSIAEIVSKILTLDTNVYIKQRQEILEELLRLLSQPWGDDINTPVNISFVLCDVIEKSVSGVKITKGAKQILSYIYTPKFCEGLMNNVISEVEQVAIYSAPVLLTALTSIRQLAENKDQCKNLQLVQKYSELMTNLKFNLVQSSQLSALFKQFLVKAVDRLDVQKSRSNTLGLGRIKLIESLFYMLKYDLFSLKTAVPETKFFERLFALMRQYHMNNVLHNEIVKIISFVLETDEGTSLLPNLFNQGRFIDFLFEESEKDTKIQEELSNGKRGITRKGYIGHIVKLGQILKKLTTNKASLPTFDEDKWVAVLSLVQTQTFQYEKNLAGYTTKRGQATSTAIMFSKQDILAYHHKFLSQPPVTTYPAVQEDDKQDEIDQVLNAFQQKHKFQQKKVVEKEELQEQKSKLTQVVEVKQHIKTQQQLDQQKVIQEQIEKEEKEGRQIHSLVNYWKGSKKMNFNIDDLMNEIN